MQQGFNGGNFAPNQPTGGWQQGAPTGGTNPNPPWPIAGGGVATGFGGQPAGPQGTNNNNPHAPPQGYNNASGFGPSIDWPGVGWPNKTNANQSGYTKIPPQSSNHVPPNNNYNPGYGQPGPQITGPQPGTQPWGATAGQVAPAPTPIAPGFNPQQHYGNAMGAPAAHSASFQPWGGQPNNNNAGNYGHQQGQGFTRLTQQGALPAPALPPPREIKFYKNDKPYFSFTNFYLAPFELDGKVWATSEHYFQAAKFHCQAIRELIRRAPSPRMAFILAREHYEEHKRPDWEYTKENFMARALQAKFSQHANLYEELRGAGMAKLIEDSPCDPYWGVGKDGKGLNRLGELLMTLRGKIADNSIPRPTSEAPQVLQSEILTDEVINRSVVPLINNGGGYLYHPFMIFVQSKSIPFTSHFHGASEAQ